MDSSREKNITIFGKNLDLRKINDDAHIELGVVKILLFILYF